MTKKEKIRALKVMIKNIDKINIYQCWGLCALADKLYTNRGGLNAYEYDYIIGIIEDEHSKKRIGTDDYLWKRHHKPPRIKFLEKHLEELLK